MRGVEAAYEEFLNEVSFIEGRLLLLAELKELREKIRSIRPIARLRDEFGPLRYKIKEFTDRLYEMSLSLSLVYTISCLEKFLRNTYLELGFNIEKKDRGIFSSPKEFLKRLSKRIGVDYQPDDLAKRVEAIFQKRHIIVHRDGLIDKDAYGIFKQAKIDEGNIGDRLILDSKKLKDDVSYIKKFAERVKNLVTRHRL